jgi:3'(2'), 5'-bisphosphate nucleotidase
VGFLGQKVAVDSKLLEKYMCSCRALAQRTGTILMELWRQPQNLVIHKKADSTPSTNADLAAHREITAGLQNLTPNIPILSEENEWPDYAVRQQWQHYWLIDPLDGTRGFIAHLAQFSINIALMEERQPILGMIYTPADQTIYYAWRGSGAFKQIGAQAPQQIRPPERPANAPWRIVIGQYSRGRRVEQLIRNRCDFSWLHANGSVKFGWLAQGQADIYPRFGPISEWDTAAGQCILNESGGAVVDLQGRTLQYNDKDSLLNPEFIAVADARWVEFWLNILKT